MQVAAAYVDEHLAVLAGVVLLEGVTIKRPGQVQRPLLHQRGGRDDPTDPDVVAVGAGMNCAVVCVDHRSISVVAQPQFGSKNCSARLRILASFFEIGLWLA
jgi:hypothetical protein